jgi:NADPH:quinone reductase-like Zn-dependent oxidoreductase
MQAVVCRRSGSPAVLQVEEIERPSAPPDGILVRVRAASLNPADSFQLTPVAHLARRLAVRRRVRGDVLGTDFCGVVESVGEGVSEFGPGDEVFGTASGAFAEYVCTTKLHTVVRKPANITFEQAAAVPIAGVTALQALLDHGRVQPGQRVLVNGASGGVGTFAVQIARALGATVTAVCSPSNVDAVRSLGAGRVIDYTKEDFTEGSERYDLMVDIAGSHSWPECARVLESEATLVAVGTSSAHTLGKVLGHAAHLRLRSIGASRRLVIFLARIRQADLLVLQRLLESGKLTPVIDRRYPLSQAAGALAYLQAGHARGKIVLIL